LAMAPAAPSVAEVDDTHVARLACAARLCAAQPKLRQILSDVAKRARPTPPEVAKGSLCYEICGGGHRPEAFGLLADDLVPSDGWVHRARDAETDRLAQSRRCIEQWETLVEVPALPLVTLSNRARRALHACGVVRVTGLFEDQAWLTDVSDRLAKLQMDRDKLEARARLEGVAKGAGARITEDILLPADGKLLLSGVGDFLTYPPLVEAIRGYFSGKGSEDGDDASDASFEDALGAAVGHEGGMRLSYASWIVAPQMAAQPQEATSTSAPQKVHADLASARSMVSMHLALHDIDAALGPTAFCPGTVSGKDKALARIVRVAMLDKARSMSAAGDNNYHASVCEAFVPPFTKRGSVTIYDSALFHYGTANVGEHPRAVLNANFAAKVEAIEEENYGRNFNDSSLAELRWFRRVFNQSLYADLSDGSVCRDLDPEKDDDIDECIVWGTSASEGPRRAVLRQRLLEHPRDAASPWWKHVLTQGSGAIFVLTFVNLRSLWRRRSADTEPKTKTKASTKAPAQGGKKKKR